MLKHRLKSGFYMFYGSYNKIICLLVFDSVFKDSL